MSPKKSKHHRKCRSNGGSNDLSNLSFIKEKEHTAWHYLFQNYEAGKIALLITDKFLDPEWELVARKKRSD
jgi:hypothetical protein